jgi:hypothetical protein
MPQSWIGPIIGSVRVDWFNQSSFTARLKLGMSRKIKTQPAFAAKLDMEMEDNLNAQRKIQS